MAIHTDRQLSTLGKSRICAVLAAIVFLFHNYAIHFSHWLEIPAMQLVKPFAEVVQANNSCPHDSLQYGILYFAYHIDRNRTNDIMANVVTSIKGLRLHNPCVQVAVASNHILGQPSELRSWGINDTLLIDNDDILEGPDSKHGRQWWTRTVYLAKTPYNYTIQLDSDRCVCGNIQEMFHHLESYDFIGVSAGILPNLDNGVMAWRTSAKTDMLFEKWKEGLLKQGKTGNDQPSLAWALDALPDVKAGVMNPSFQVKYIPAIGEAWGRAAASRTLVLHGPAKIVAGAQNFCDLLNAGSKWPRILLQTHKKQRFLAFSQAECDDYMNGTCGFKELDWGLDFNIMPRQQYLQMYT
jgi:hypothetical protein